MERLECITRRELIDSAIKSYISEATIVMFGYERQISDTIEQKLRRMHAFEHIIKRIIEDHQGSMIEHALWLFPNPPAALSAVLRIRDGSLRAYTNDGIYCLYVRY